MAGRLQEFTGKLQEFEGMVSEVRRDVAAAFPPPGALTAQARQAVQRLTRLLEATSRGPLLCIGSDNSHNDQNNERTPRRQRGTDNNDKNHNGLRHITWALMTTAVSSEAPGHAS